MCNSLIDVEYKKVKLTAPEWYHEFFQALLVRDLMLRAVLLNRECFFTCHHMHFIGCLRMKLKICYVENGFLVFDSEVVQEGFVVVLGGEAGVAEEFADVVPFAETTVVEHL